MMRYVPSAITLCRPLLGVVVAVLCIKHLWAWAFWLFVLAMLTDFLDGWAARTFKVSTPGGALLDAYSDSALVAGSFIGLTVAGVVPLWLLLVIFVGGGLYGGGWGWPKTGLFPAIQKLGSVTLLFIAWFGVALLLASLAWGWAWWYLVALLCTLCALAGLKRGRIRSWARGDD